MATLSVTVHSRIPALTAAMVAKAGLAVAKAAQDIEAHAKARAPVDTGFLKNSIGASGGGLEWRVDSPAHYSAYLEFGTSRMSARPYFIPAVETVRPVFIAAMRSLV